MTRTFEVKVALTDAPEALLVSSWQRQRYAPRGANSYHQSSEWRGREETAQENDRASARRPLAPLFGLIGRLLSPKFLGGKSA